MREGERRTRAERPLRFVGVGDFADFISKRVIELERFAGVAQPARPTAHDIRDLRIGGVKCCQVRRNYEVGAGPHARAGRKCERQPFAYLPAGKIDGRFAVIIKLKPFATQGFRHTGWVKHDFVEEWQREGRNRREQKKKKHPREWEDTGA